MKKKFIIVNLALADTEIPKYVSANAHMRPMVQNSFIQIPPKCTLYNSEEEAEKGIETDFGKGQWIILPIYLKS